MNRLLLPFFCGALVYALVSAAHAQELRIRMPQASDMHLHSPDQYTGLVSFSGQVQLQGQLLLVSQHKAIDYAAPGIPSAFEWRVALLFQPDPAERDKLPQVRYTHEADAQGAPVIELNFFQPEQMAGAIETIFGTAMAARAGKQAFEAGRRGRLRLKSYRSGIECDRRYHYAELVAFESQQALPAAQARQLVRQLPAACR